VTAIDAARRGMPVGPPPLVFLAITLSVVVVFAIFVAAALYMRKRSDYHKRLMALATLTVIQPAVARVAVDVTGIFHPLLFFGITDVMLVLFIAWDTIRNRRLHPAFGWGMLFFIISQPVRFVIAGSGPWLEVAKWLTAI
jgi:asparagine N-glycosylation enzyme membrane subunit Stt3